MLDNEKYKNLRYVIKKKLSDWFYLIPMNINTVLPSIPVVMSITSMMPLTGLANGVDHPWSILIDPTCKLIVKRFGLSLKSAKCGHYNRPVQLRGKQNSCRLVWCFNFIPER